MIVSAAHRRPDLSAKAALRERVGLPPAGGVGEPPQGRASGRGTPGNKGRNPRPELRAAGIDAAHAAGTAPPAAWAALARSLL